MTYHVYVDGKWNSVSRYPVDAIGAAYERLCFYRGYDNEATTERTVWVYKVAQYIQMFQDWPEQMEITFPARREGEEKLHYIMLCSDAYARQMELQEGL